MTRHLVEQCSLWRGSCSRIIQLGQYFWCVSPCNSNLQVLKIITVAFLRRVKSSPQLFSTSRMGSQVTSFHLGRRALGHWLLPWVNYREGEEAKSPAGKSKDCLDDHVYGLFGVHCTCLSNIIFTATGLPFLTYHPLSCVHQSSWTP